MVLRTISDPQKLAFNPERRDAEDGLLVGMACFPAASRRIPWEVSISNLESKKWSRNYQQCLARMSSCFNRDVARTARAFGNNDISSYWASTFVNMQLQIFAGRNGPYVIEWRSRRSSSRAIQATWITLRWAWVPVWAGIQRVEDAPRRRNQRWNGAPNELLHGINLIIQRKTE
jgi:hypothetical protein